MGTVDRDESATPIQSDPSSQSRISQLLARGSVWSAGGYIGGQVLRFGSNLVLWRLLFEEAFGVMALVNAFLIALEMFSDIGIGPSIIQNKRDDAHFANTAWTFQVARGVLLWIISCALAIPMARFYAQAELVSLLPIVGFTAVINGFNSSKIFAEQRRVALGRITALVLTSQLASTVAMIAWALFHPSIWALAIGNLVGAFVRMAGSHIALPGPTNRFRWDVRAARDIVRFGRWIFFSTLLTFIALQSDRLIFGKIVPMSVLGVYSIAQIYATLPGMLVGHLASSVIFPLLSQRQNAGDAIGPIFMRVRVPILVGAGYLISCLLAGGPTLVSFLYDERAADAGWMIQILALGSMFLTLEGVASTLLLSRGVPHWLAAANGTKVLGMAILIPTGYGLFGFPGAIGGFALCDTFKYGVSAWALRKHQVHTLRQDFAFIAAVALSTSAGLAARSAARELTAPVFVEGLAIWLVLSALWGAAWALRKQAGPPVFSPPDARPTH